MHFQIAVCSGSNCIEESETNKTTGWWKLLYKHVQYSHCLAKTLDFQSNIACNFSISVLFSVNNREFITLCRQPFKTYHPPLLSALGTKQILGICSVSILTVTFVYILGSLQPDNSCLIYLVILIFSFSSSVLMHQFSLLDVMHIAGAQCYKMLYFIEKTTYCCSFSKIMSHFG